MKDISFVFEKAISISEGYNSKIIASAIEMNSNAWCRLEDDSNLKWYLISKHNGKSVVEYYGYVSYMFPVAVIMNNCPKKIVQIIEDCDILIEKYYNRYMCNEKILSKFVDKPLLDDRFLFNDKIPFDEEIFTAIDEGVDYINPYNFKFEELL